MALQLHDSLSRSLKTVTPSQPDGVYRFYNCGPTVYAAAHIGNFRTFVVNDLIRRLLELEFGADKVRHVRNLTDVDDKTIRRAREEGRPLRDVTAEWTAKFHADCDALGCLRPHVEPAATDHIPEQVNMIEVLMEKGNAYRAADGSVYFKVSSFDGYGALSRVKERELKAGSALAAGNTGTKDTTSVDSDEKEDGTDFALWKAWKPEDGDVKWTGPDSAAEGRPGWHIECSAMSKKHLGDTIDLHTGGVDLLFPHHENEIAQSECCNGTSFAHHWYHSEHLLVDGKKMSKSLGNLYTLDQLKEMGHTPMALRYAFLAGHPRKQLNFMLSSLGAAAKALSTLHQFRTQLGDQTGDPAKFDPVFKALQDDLNTPGALGALFSIVNAGPAEVDAATFDRVMFALGLDLTPTETESVEIPAEVTALAEKRWAAKQAKDWPAADALRGEITAAGWTMKDRKDGYDLEPAKG
ncbi:cysteine--tRNA ligase [Synoicihabitans lomoniglobus]|uniref:Cysteine--tRNA ligase n=1 Tax=Synoicihabitans lomoniglobus TaxID=2909285 RepID=A0AAF0CQB3_9BACT|nr:cysteine--tRNA ligase [Opitutaceae bacterium LMO-M01]WED66077.1 cysteine--tRNA ligase [Opitutaceae bacterium LMO-M01]